MLKKDYLPESMYSLDSEITREDLSVGKVVTGLVTVVRQAAGYLLVDLGNGLNGFMKVKNSTMYPPYKDNGGVAPNVYILVGRTIRAKIISMGVMIELSRKDHMLEALPFLKEKTEFANVSISSFSRLSAFVDVGAGIMGKISTLEYAPCIYEDIRDVGLEIGSIFPAKNLGFNENYNSFELSRKAMLPKDSDVLKVQDIVSCKVFGRLPDGIGYFVLINQTFSAILDSPQELKYGDMVLGVVKKITPKGPRLDLVLKQ